MVLNYDLRRCLYLPLKFELTILLLPEVEFELPLVEDKVVVDFWLDMWFSFEILTLTLLDLLSLFEEFV